MPCKIFLSLRAFRGYNRFKEVEMARTTRGTTTKKPTRKMRPAAAGGGKTKAKPKTKSC